MNKLLQLGITLTACTLAPLVSAQKDVPEKAPGTPSPGSPPNSSDSARPETNREHGVDPKIVSEEDFVKTAAKKGIAELKVAQLAVEQAEDAKVKELAEMLVKDHTAANADLKTIAGSMGIKPGEHADEKAGQKCKELKGRSGKEFDTAFLEHVSMSHDKGIACYEAGKKVARTEPVVAYIDKTLPVLKVHAAKIRQLHTGTRPDAGAAEPGKSDDSQSGNNR